MKVFYDHQAFSLQNYGGVSRIFSELLKSSIQQKQFQTHLSILFSRNKHLAESGYKCWQLSSREASKQLNHLYNVFELSTSKYDIYHPTYYDPSLIGFSKKKPVVVTFHDMIHEKFNKVFPEVAKEKKIIEQKKAIASKATHIIAVSENTKKDLMAIYGVAEKKITVVHLGSSLPTFSFQPHKTANGQKPYILYVGNRFAHKNFKAFTKAIAPVLRKNDVELICAGAKPFDNDELDLLRTHKIEYLVRQVSINDKLLARLYANAIAFAFPSLYEGFGIPITEAFSCSCPCVLSNISSLPEVGGDAALYFDPYKDESMANAIDEIINNSELRHRLAQKGKERLKQFSWEKHVNQTVQVYSTLI